MFYASTPSIKKCLVPATMRIYIYQLTYQLILVQDINECRQDPFWGVPSAPIEALSTFLQQLLDSYLKDKQV